MIHVVGHTAIDHISRVPSLPARNGSATITDRKICFGGGAANIAAGIARLGGDVTLVSAVGDDFAGSGYEWCFTRGYGALSFGIPRDGLVSMKFSLTETGPIHNGKVICVQDIPNGSFPFSGTAVAQAGASAGGYMRAVLHVVTFSLLSGTPSIAFTIETDDNSGFTTPSAARLSFAAVTTKTSEWKEVLTTPGWAGETHVRLKAVLTGGTANVAVVCLVQQG